MDSRWLQVAVVLLIGIVILGLIHPVAAQSDLDTSNLNIGDTESLSETNAGEEIEIESSAEIPDLPVDWSAQLEFVAYAGDNQIGSQTVSIEDGNKADVSITHEFEESGDKDVYFEVSGEIERDGPVATQTATVERTTRTMTVDVSLPVTTTEGAALETPESIQNEVDDLREEVPQTTGPHAFILTSTDELYVVFSTQELEEGYASVKGVSPNVDPLETSGLEFGVIAANNVEFEAPQQASVSEVYQNSESYDREYVEITAHHRYASLDYENEPFSATAGVLVEEPLEASDLFGSVGSKSRTAIDEPDGASINRVVEMSSQERIVTTSSETEYWTDGEVTLSGIVAAPETPARDYIQTFQEDGILPADSNTPVMYVIDEEYDAQDVSSITEMSENAEQYDGGLVSFESNLYMNTISTKRVVERSTGTQLPPVDTILHGGVAWNQLPQTRDDAIIIMAASSIEQKQLLDDRSGTYRITGEVVSTGRIEGELPQDSILIVYDLERVDSTNTASSNELIEQLSTSVSDTMEQQADPQVDASEVGGDITDVDARIDVGAGENGFQFAPDDVTIEAGSSVVWEWTGDGGAHNVVSDDDNAEFESELTDEEGYTFTHTFEDPGTYEYVCVPHRAQGMSGQVTVENEEQNNYTAAPGEQVTITTEINADGDDLSAYGVMIEDEAPLTVVSGSSDADFASVQVDDPDEEEDLFVLYFSTTESVQSDTIEFSIEAASDATVGETFDLNSELTAGSTTTTDTFTVEIVEEESLSIYTNENGIVDNSGVTQAIVDWQAGEIDNGLIVDVVVAWQSGEPVN